MSIFKLDDVHIMLDLETLDTEPTAAIVSIGAVAFSPLEPPGQWAHLSPSLVFPSGVESRFYRSIIVSDAMKYGTVGGDTLTWWAGQEDSARISAFHGSYFLADALAAFAWWVGRVGKFPYIWCNPAHFDFTILENAYRKTGIKVHKCWDFRAGRCYRTFRHLFEPMFPDLKFEEPKVKHHALEDAMAQAKHMQKIVQALSSSSVGA